MRLIRAFRCFLIGAMVLVSMTPAFGQAPSQQVPAAVPESPAPAVQAPVPALTPAEVIAQIEQAFRVRDKVLTTLLQRIEALERELATLRAAAGTPASEAAPPSTNVLAAPASPQPPAATPPARNELYEEEERLARAALERALVARGGLLLPRWTLEVEQNATYYNASSDLISIDGFTILPVLVVGDIVSERIRRDILRVAFTSRLGMPGGLQADFRLPFGYEQERIVTADSEERSRSVAGVGDFEIGLTRQLTRERGARPATLVGVNWKTATGRDPFRLNSTEPPLGTGFHGVNVSVTAAKTSDPVVFFGGLSYTANLAASKRLPGFDPAAPEEIREGRFNPGDVFGLQMGLALGLNPETSISVGWSQRLTASTTFDGAALPGTFLTDASLRIGTSYVYAPSRAVDIGLGIGLTRDAPDFNVSVAFPFRFSLSSPRSAP